MKPVNENATKEAKELLAYLYETAGKKIITGQHTQTNPMEEITYIHEKTTPIKNEDKDISCSPEHDPRPNWFRNIRRPRCKIDKRISYFFSAEKVFYQDNEIGEIVRNYLQWCVSSSIVN